MKRVEESFTSENSLNCNIKTEMKTGVGIRLIDICVTKTVGKETERNSLENLTLIEVEKLYEQLVFILGR